MKPDITSALNTGSMTLLGEIAPLLEGGYGGGTVTSISIMMLFAAKEAEQGAQMRVLSIGDMRELFGEAAALVSDKSLAVRLEVASRGAEDSLLISKLDETRSRLRALMIELHAHIEQQQAGWARTLDLKIWDVLAKDTERFEIVLE